MPKKCLYMMGMYYLRNKKGVVGNVSDNNLCSILNATQQKESDENTNPIMLYIFITIGLHAACHSAKREWRIKIPSCSVELFSLKKCYFYCVACSPTSIENTFIWSTETQGGWRTNYWLD